MTYWHIQLQPDDPRVVDEADILKKTGLIGLEEREVGQRQINSFYYEMKVGDIALVKRGRLAIALVEVVGEAWHEPRPNKRLDWFGHRRKIKILEILDTHKYGFPQPGGMLTKSINKETKTYQYINAWHNRLLSRPSPSPVQKRRVSEIYIENHKMFVDFKLSFLNKEGEASPLIILAGINGSGKTTLLEYIDAFETRRDFKDEDYIEVESAYDKIADDVKRRRIYKSSTKNQGKTGIIELRNNIRYFPVSANSTKDTQELIVEYINKLIKNNNRRPSEAYEHINELIKDTFESLDFNISFSYLDEKDNVFFINQEGREFPISGLSTGEQTLLSKIFHLYIGDYAGKIILIDEPELSLHPTWQGKALDIYETFCGKNKSQIIIATHSPQIIGAAKKEYLRILSMDKGKAEVIQDLPSYGRDINWVLKNVMGVQSVRIAKVAKKIEKCRNLLDEGSYAECEKYLDALVNEIGEHDPEVLELRNILFFEQD